MAAEAIADPLFLDTSLIIAATVEAHPAHKAASNSSTLGLPKLERCLRLVQQFEVHGKQVHDCNIVATMLTHGVRHLATRNAADFTRYESLISIEAISD